MFSSLGSALLPGRAQEEPSEETAPVSEPALQVPVSAAKSFTLLCAVHNDNGTLTSAFLLRFDTDNYRVALCDLPATAVLLADKAPKTVRELYATRGAQGVCAAVRDTLGVTVDGVVGMGMNELRSVVDTLGEFACNLPCDVTVYDAEGIMIYSKHAGNVQMNGNDVAMVLQYNNLTDAERSRLGERILQSALAANADDRFSGKIYDMYQRNVNGLDTDVSSATLVRLAKAAAAVCTEKGAQLEAVRIEGSYNDGRFELAEDSQDRLKLYFP